MKKLFDHVSIFWLAIVLLSSYLVIFHSYRYNSSIPEFSGFLLLVSLCTFYFAFIEIPISNGRLNKFVNNILAAVFTVLSLAGISELGEEYNRSQIEKYNCKVDGVLCDYKYENSKIYGVVKYSVNNETYFTDIENPEYKIKINTKFTVECSRRQPERAGQITFK